MPSWGGAGGAAALVRDDPRLLEQRAADLVEPAEQHLPPVGIHREGRGEAQPVLHALLLQIHRQPELAARGPAAAEQLVDLARQQAHRRSPFWQQLAKKISANDGATMA